MRLGHGSVPFTTGKLFSVTRRGLQSPLALNCVSCGVLGRKCFAKGSEMTYSLVCHNVALKLSGFGLYLLCGSHDDSRGL